MDHGHATTLFVSIFALTSCAEDQLSVRAGRLTLTVEPQAHYASSSETPLPTIALGDVALGASSLALFRLTNGGDAPLRLTDAAVVEDDGGTWQVSVVGAAGGEILPGAHALLRVVYRPEAIETTNRARVAVTADLPTGGRAEAEVSATGVFRGNPQIEVAWGESTAPRTGDCGGGAACVVPTARAIQMGNVGLGQVGSAEVTIRNTATCAPLPGAAACDTCALSIAPGPDGDGVGLGLRDGSNDEGRFSLTGVTSMPVTIGQRDLSCGAAGEWRFHVAFRAPQAAGVFQSVLVIESNDPNAARLEIPIRASVVDVPVAVARLREYDNGNPSAPYTEADAIAPLDRVYLDGRDSYDPRDPNDPSLLVSYRWSVVEYPEGTNPDDFDFQSGGTATPSFWIPLAGRYVVELIVMNDVGLESGTTVESRVEFEAVPQSRLHIQLVWDNATNDQDLHLVRVASGSAPLCSSSADVYWDNFAPQWFTAAPAGTGPNPRLDIDDTDGLGPENVNIDSPTAGTYRIYVNYYWDETSSSDQSPTTATVRVFLDGQLRGEYTRRLAVHDVWAVADVTWNTTGGTLTPYTQDATNQIGAIANAGDSQAVCQDPGWLFP